MAAHCQMQTHLHDAFIPNAKWKTHKHCLKQENQKLPPLFLPMYPVQTLLKVCNMPMQAQFATGKNDTAAHRETLKGPLAHSLRSEAPMARPTGGHSIHVTVLQLMRLLHGAASLNK